MSDTPTPPAGWTWGHFKYVCADVGSWTWGTAQGAFNEKASFSQILVDAIIGMVPLLGDATAVRDLIAIIIGLIDEPKKRVSVWQWVLLVVLLLALIPVLGGVAKGVGRILCKVFEDAAKLRGAARLACIAEGAKEIIAFLNRIGVKNAEKWLSALHFSEYQAQIMERFSGLMNTFDGALKSISKKMGGMMPGSLAERIAGLRQGIADLKNLGNTMIPQAVKELDQDLRELQAYVRSGGETTSRVALHEVATGERVVTRAEEARLVEDGVLPVRSARGGFVKNAADAKDPKSWEKYYKPESGYPDLTKKVEKNKLPEIAAFSGGLVNRELKPGEEVYRLFGPEGFTHQFKVDGTHPGGAWWGLGAPPKTAKEWREHAAVLDEWNHDGYMLVGKVSGKGPKSVVGTISEQAGVKLPGQYLQGGGTQAVFYLDDVAKKQLSAMSADVLSGKTVAPWLDPISGIEYEMRPTGWTDANGIWGYVHTPGVGTVQTARLAAREIATKKNNEVVVTP